MKIISLLLVFFSSAFSLFSQEAKIELNGSYQGYNIYVQNPFPPCGPVDTCPCVYKVLVNGIQTKDDIMAPAFQIDLSHYNFKIGDSLTIDIFHTSDCHPKVLSIHHGRKNVMEISPLTIDANGVLHWKTKNENGLFPFIIESYCWNKWVKLGEVDGKGDSLLNEYSFTILQHSGENVIRIKQQNKPVSESISFTSKIPEIKYEVDKLSKIMNFTEETYYEIYNEDGDLLKKGRERHVNLESLKHGNYYLNYDRFTVEFEL